MITGIGGRVCSQWTPETPKRVDEVVTAARALSPKLHISYLDLCCLDARTPPLSSLGITLCI